jgi:hypothetical protein
MSTLPPENTLRPWPDRSANSFDLAFGDTRDELRALTSFLRRCGVAPRNAAWAALRAAYCYEGLRRWGDVDVDVNVSFAPNFSSFGDAG